MHTIIEKGWIHFGQEWDSVDENGNENGNFHDISIGVCSATEGDLYIRGVNAGTISIDGDEWDFCVSPEGPFGVRDVTGSPEDIATDIAEQMHFSHKDFDD